MPSTKTTLSTSDISPTMRRTVQNMARLAESQTVEDGMLAECARQLIQARIEISSFLPKGLFRDSAWDIMLELFITEAEGGVIYVKQLILASGESTASAMRLIDRLQNSDFIDRISDPLDQRRVIVQLTERGHLAMVRMLKHIITAGVHQGNVLSDDLANCPARSE